MFQSGNRAAAVAKWGDLAYRLREDVIVPVGTSALSLSIVRYLFKLPHQYGGTLSPQNQAAADSIPKQ